MSAYNISGLQVYNLYDIEGYEVAEAYDIEGNEIFSGGPIPQPANSYYFQGCKFHDGILWYANGYSGSSTGAYVFGVNPSTGEVLYTINCETTAEPEGVAWYPDNDAAGGYALYVGFAGMMLRKYTFQQRQ